VRCLRVRHRSRPSCGQMRPPTIRGLHAGVIEAAKRKVSGHPLYTSTRSAVADVTLAKALPGAWCLGTLFSSGRFQGTVSRMRTTEPDAGPFSAAGKRSPYYVTGVFPSHLPIRSVDFTALS